MLKQKLKSFKIKKSLIYANRTCFARGSSCQKTINLDQVLKLINVRLIFLKKKLLSLYRPIGFWNFSILRVEINFAFLVEIRSISIVAKPLNVKYSLST